MIFQLGVAMFGFSQDTISLIYCLDKTTQNHPRSGNSAILESITENKIQNIRTGNLPQVELNGRASYQSDVIGLDIPIPNIDIPTSPRDQYKLSLDITQSIYDGGITKNKQRIEGLSEQLDKSQLEMDIRTSKMQVKDLFYNILIIQKNEEILDISLSQLLKNKMVVETGIKNGALLNTDMDLLDVEIIRMKQRKMELENARITGLQVLGYKMGEEISGSTLLKQTNFIVPKNDSIQRLEERLFDLQSQQLGQNIELIKSRALPKVFAFGQFGYGNPGLNVLKNGFDTYYVVGAGLKWTIWDWKNSSRDKELVGLQQNIIESRKNQFETEINAALMNQKSVIKNHAENLEAYGNIMVLRSHITETAKKQLENGVIRTIDFVAVLDQETIARIQFETEKTLLQQSIARYLEIKGEL